MKPAPSVLFGRVREQCDRPRALESCRQRALVTGARPGHPARKDLAPVAHEAAQQNQGKPRLLPVRVNYEEALPDPLAGILDPLQYALWKGPEDDERLISELVSSLRASPTPKPAKLPKKLTTMRQIYPLLVLHFRPD